MRQFGFSRLLKNIMGMGLAMVLSLGLDAQGGNTCASAQANPITIPFSISGQSTCGSGNDYNATNLPTLCNGISLIGEDYLYYFTAPSSGFLYFKVIIPASVSPAMALFQGCPSSGTCINSVYAANQDTLGLITYVVAGQSYFLVIDNNGGPCYNYSLSISYTGPGVNQGCVNADFESGTFSGWGGSYGYIESGVPDVTYNVIQDAIVSPHMVITTPQQGPDPCGLFPKVAPGGQRSVRLGDGPAQVGSRAAQMYRTFNVTASNAIFNYQYAVVLNDGGHTTISQPFFEIKFIDQYGNNIPCGYYLVTAAGNIPGFQLCPQCNFGGNTWAKPWTAVAVDLTQYIGQDVSVIFTVTDCSLSGHYGYAYIDCSCAPAIIATSVNDSICPGSCTTLSAPSGFLTYQWTTPQGPGGNGQSITACVPGVYSVQLTQVNNSVCVSTITDTLFSLPVPQASFSYTSSGNCSNGNLTVNFTNTSTINQGSIVSWSWNFGDNTTSSQTNPTHTYLNPGTYNVQLIVVSNLGCVDTITIPVSTSSSGNPVTAAFSFNTLCQGDTANFIDQSSGGAVSWSWNFGDPGSGNNNISSIQSPQHCFSGSGQFTVTLIVTSSSGCTDTIQSVVTIQSAPLITCPSVSTCGGGPVTLSTSSPSQVSWLWLPSNTTGSQITVTPTSNTTYTVIATTTSGCSSSSTVTVTLVSSVTASFSASPICFGDSLSFINTSTGASVWAWNFGDPSTGPANISSSYQPSHLFSAPGTYIVTLIASASSGNCSDTFNLPVQVLPSPQLIGGPVFTCLGVPLTIVAGIQSGVTYQWLPGNFTTSSINLQPSTNVTYTLTVTNSSGCTDSVHIPVYVILPPVANFTYSTPCLGKPVNFQDQSSSTNGNIITWNWDFGDNTYSALQNPSHIYNSAGQYQVILTVYNSFGCSDTIIRILTIDSIPSIVVHLSDSEGCAPLCVDFSIAYSDTSLSGWNWLFSNGVTSSVQAPNQICFQSAGDYGYVLNATYGAGCLVTVGDSLAISVHPSPVAVFTPDPASTSILNPVIHFINQSQNVQTFTWWCPGGSETSPIAWSPVVTYADTGAFCATLWTYNSYGCADSTSECIMITDMFSFYVPNAFTPNGDGHNELWFPVGVGISSDDFHIEVYDRWGMLIWETSVWGKAWDGKVTGGASGETVQEDVYVWKCFFRDIPEGRKHQLTGSVTVIK